MRLNSHTTRALVVVFLLAIMGTGGWLRNRRRGVVSSPFTAISISEMLQSGRVRLYSLDPYNEEPEDDPAGTTRFRGWREYGSIPLSASESDRVLHSLQRGIDAGELIAACFWPRHGVRWEDGERWLDFVICFECLQVEVYGPDRQWSLAFAGEEFRPVFDELLSDADVQLAPQSPE